MTFRPSLYAAFLGFTLGVTAQAQNLNIYEYIYPQGAFDEAAAQRQLEAGNSSIRGTISAKENKALIKSLNMSKTRFAYPGTRVTLMPENAYINEWRNLQKQLQRKSTLKKAVLSNEAYSYRILTKVVDDKGSFEFTNLKPGKYFIYAEVNFVKAGFITHQSGSIDTVHVGSGQVLASTPTYESQEYAVDVTKVASAVVEITSDGQVVDVKVSGQ